MRQQQPFDAMVRDGEIVFGTSLWRLQDAIDQQPLDQESTEFYAGDIRDVCSVCDGNDKFIASLKDKAKGLTSGAVVNLPIADVKRLIVSAKKPAKTEVIAS